MFCSSSLLTIHHRFALLVVLALLVNMFPAAPSLASASPKGVKSGSRTGANDTRPASATQPMPLPQAPVQSFVRVVNLPTNDILFNVQTQKIHASVPSSAGSNGNSITEVDPVDGTVGQSVFIGSEPNGSFLWVGDGTAATYTPLLTENEWLKAVAA